MRTQFIYRLVGGLIIIFTGTWQAFSQGVPILGENVDLVDASKIGAYANGQVRYSKQDFKADSLYLGAPFLRDTTKPFIVWFDHTPFPGSVAHGDLYLKLYDGTEIFLFSNYDPPGVKHDLTAQVRGRINNLDTVYFVYKTGGNAHYTGPNRSPLDKQPDGITPKWQNTDRYWATDTLFNYPTNDLPMCFLPQTCYPSTKEPLYYDRTGPIVGRRYSLAGWIRENGARTDTVEFAFEDGFDKNYSDNIFHVTGLFLIRKETYERLELDAYPNIDTLHAGDSVTYSAGLWGRDTSGAIFHGPDDTLVSRHVTWELIRPQEDQNAKNNPDLRQGQGPTGRNTFVATEAYEQFKIHITFVQNGTRLDTTKTVYILPGNPDHLVIEGTPNGLTVSPRDDNPIPSVTIGSTQPGTSVYAVLRDVYGNYISASPRTNWSVVSGPTVVSVAGGNAAQGEGVITKLGPVDTARVAAQYADSPANPKLRSTVKVLIDAVVYDSLRIVNESGNRLARLDIKLTQDTVLLMQGYRSDLKIWQPVSGNWQLSPPMQSSVAAPSQNNKWDAFTPTVLGSGTITITLGTKTTSIPLTVQPGGPDKVVLYPAGGDPKNVAKFESPFVFSYPAIAGSPFNAYARAFDPYNTWLAEYDTVPSNATSFTWEVRDTLGNPADTSIGKLTATSGVHVAYTPVKAYKTLNIIVKFLKGTWGPFYDTVRIVTNPDRASKLVIEADSTPDMNAPDRLSRIELSPKVNSVFGYGVLRDQFDNFVRFADSASWYSREPAKVTAAMGAHSSVGEGVITRITGNKDSTWVIAFYSGLIDSVQVVIQDIFYTKLRVVDAAGNPVTTLTMFTDENTTLRVQGNPSNDLTGNVWVDVAAKWEADTSILKTSTSPPTLNHEWSFSPDYPDTSGTGWIRVTLGTDTNVTTPGWVKPVIFNRSPPSSVEFEILTPAEKRIAGDTIVAVSRIRNNDGLVPGTYCTTSQYSDALGNGGRPDPTANGQPLGAPLSDCFVNGIDTVKFVLYYAPVNKDSTHQIFVAVGALKDTSDRFNLLPGALARLELEDSKNNPVDSTIQMAYPDGAALLFSIGFDRFGNRIGEEKSDWSTSGTLHQIPKAQNVSRVYYDASTVTDDESGTIKAVAVDISGGVKSDTVAVVIRGPLISLKQAITRDLNGDGLIDAIELHFTKPVAIPANKKDSIAVWYGSTNFINDGIRGRDSAIDSVYIISVHTKDSSVAQTGWTPDVSLTGLSGITPIPRANPMVSTDGAGAVIWKVYKLITSALNRNTDQVKVVLSEKVQTVGLDVLPKDLFGVYQRNTAGGWDTVQNFFDGIAGLTEFKGDTIIFTMTNGNDLMSNDYLNIITGKITISDKSASANATPPNNQKVQVVPVGDLISQAKSFPNPSVPTFKHVLPGDFKAEHERNARAWVFADRAGSIISFTLSITKEEAYEVKKISAFVKIYDIVGNPVNDAQTDDLLKNFTNDFSTVRTIDFYWNGSNTLGMPVAAGVYRAVVYVTYESGKEKQRLVTNIGIGR